MTAASTPTTAAGSGRRRGARKGDLKEAAILDTAGRLLAEKSLEAITVEDLTSGAGISRSTFYFYFDSKDAAIRTLAERVVDDVESAVAPFLRRGVPVEVSVREGVGSYLRRWRDHGAVLRAMERLAEGDAGFSRYWIRVSDDVVEPLARNIERGRERGVVPSGPPARDLVHALAGMLHEAGYTLSLEPLAEAEEAQLVDTLATVIVRAVFGSSPG